MDPVTSLWLNLGPWLGLFLFATLSVLAALATVRLAFRMLGNPKELPEAMHWTLRNRHRYQIATTQQVLKWAVPFSAMVFGGVFIASPYRWVFLPALFLLLRIILGFAGRKAVRRWDDPENPLRWEWPGRSTALWLAFGPSVILAISGTALAFAFPTLAILIFLGTLVLMTASLSRPFHQFLLAVRVLHPPRERLRKLVEDSAREVGCAVPACFEVTGFALNALAWPNWQIVGVTKQALDRLDDDEVRAVVRHELGHLTESAKVRRARNIIRMAPALLMIAPVLKPYLGGQWFLTYIATAAVIVALVLVLRRQLRHTESAADSFAAAADGKIYAATLEKIYRLNAMPAVIGGRRPHPELYDRMIAAGVTPGYPRPEPPSRRQRTLAVMVPFITFEILLGIIIIAVVAMPSSSSSSEILAMESFLSPRRGWIFDELARRESQPERVAELLDQSIAADNGIWPLPLLHRAQVAAELGDCVGSRQWLEKSRTRFAVTGGPGPENTEWARWSERFIEDRCP